MVLAQQEPFALLRARVPLPTVCWPVCPLASQPVAGRAGEDEQIGTLRQEACRGSRLGPTIGTRQLKR